ncbi:MAG: ATP-binding cassette domain-containing protein [Flavobacterium sp.]|nr:ATP-binding cassette domain-containing protein [Flavobacterium sp.]
MKPHILEADSIQKRFGEKTVVSDIYLKCQTGEILGLLGRNGSGKSTLLKIIFGIVAADNKFIRIDGVVKQTTAALFGEVSYLHQDNFIPDNFWVQKAISLSVDKQKLADFYADEMITSIKNKKVSHLSGGEKRYLEIKLILFSDSKFALLDEPYNGLSPVMSEKVNTLIVANTTQKGMIITDHNYNNVIQIATKLILMKDGKAHHLKDKKELIEKGYLLDGML